MMNSRTPSFEKVYSLALEMFGFDKDKTNAWWMAKNEELENKAPYEMVKEGKGRKLIKLIEICMMD